MKTASSASGVGRAVQLHAKKMKLEPQLVPYTEINSRGMEELSISCDTIKVIGESMGRRISDISRSIISTDMSLRAGGIKEGMNKCHLIKIKSFCMAKENSIEIKREPAIWESMFADGASDKGLISRVYGELTGLPSKKTSNTIKKWAGDLGRHFSREDIQRVQRHMRGCSASLAIREMQIKTTMRFHFTLVRMVIISKSTNSKCW